MIDALIGGKLLGTATKRIGASGKPFVTAKVKTPQGDADSLLVNVIVFDETVGAGLLALGDGDSVSLSGALSVKTWTTKSGEVRPGLDLVAHAILTSYHVKRRREAVQTKQSPATPGTTYRETYAPLPDHGLPDDPL